MKLAEFFVSLGVDADQKELDNFTQGVSELDKTLKQLKIIAVATALKIFTDQTVDASVAVQNFTNQTGELARGLQQWQLAGELADISLTADQITSSIVSLQQNLTQIRLGGGNVSPFQLLGINIAGKGAFEVLEDLRGAIVGLDNATAVNLIQQTGLSPSFINALRLGREEFEALFGEKTVISQEKRKDIIDLGTAFTSLKISFASVKDQIVAAFAPALTFVTNIFTRFIDNVADSLNFITSFKVGVNVLIGALAALALAFSPVLRIVTVLFIAIDDLFTLFTGGDSILGRLGNAFVDFGKKIVDYVLVPFREAKKLINDIKNSDMGEFFGLGSTEKVSGNLTKGIAPRLAGGGGTMNNNVSNTFNINSTADANTLSKNIADQTQRNLNYSLQEFNNGALG